MSLDSDVVTKAAKTVAEATLLSVTSLTFWSRFVFYEKILPTIRIYTKLPMVPPAQWQVA